MARRIERSRRQAHHALKRRFLHGNGDEVSRFEPARAVEAGKDQPARAGLARIRRGAADPTGRPEIHTRDIERDRHGRTDKRAGAVDQPGILRGGYAKRHLERVRVDQFGQLFVGSDQPALDDVCRGQGAVERRADLGVGQPALGLRQTDPRARQARFGLLDAAFGRGNRLSPRQNRLTRGRGRKLGGFDRRFGPDPPPGQILLPDKSALPQILLILRRIGLVPGKIQTAARVDQFCLGLLHVNARPAQRRLGVPGVDPRKQRARGNGSAILEPVQKRDDASADTGPQLKRAAALHLTECVERRNLGALLRRDDRDGEHPLAALGCTAFLRHALLQGAAYRLAGIAKQRQCKGGQNKPDQRLSYKPHPRRPNEPLVQ